VTPRTDVLVAGAGPAGSATARRLAAQGHDVVLVERSGFDAPRVGESLAPSVQPLLRDLGLWGAFLALGPVPSYGTRSAWGSGAAEAHSHLGTVWGSGWHVDRRAVDAVLARGAEEAGARLVTRTGVVGVRAQPGGWDVVLSSGVTVRAGVVVDATGRPGRVARRLGAARHRFDRLVALSCVVPGAPRTQHLLVETAPEGWWYSSPLPAGGVLVMLLTDADGSRHRGLADGAAWRAALARTDHTRSRLRGAPPVGTPVVHPAGTSRLARTDTRPWLAVGDAALAVDPVSGSGVVRALRTAAHAAETASALLRGDDPAVVGYEAARDAECTEHLLERAAFYDLERRWDTPFWTRRRVAARALAG